MHSRLCHFGCCALPGRLLWVRPCRLARSEGVIKRKDDELLDQKEQLSRLRDDFDELRGQYAALTAQGHGREQQRELSVSGLCVLGLSGSDGQQWLPVVLVHWCGSETCTSAAVKCVLAVCSCCPAGDDPAAGVED